MLGKTPGSLDDMEEELKRTLADAARYINKTYDVEGLHSSFPERLDKLRKRMGDRLTRAVTERQALFECLEPNHVIFAATRTYH